MRFRIVIVALMACLPPTVATAGVGHLPMMVGLGPGDMALSGAAAFGRYDLGSAYQNPAALADLPQSAMTWGYHYAQPMFEGGIAGRERPFRQPNNVVSMGSLLDVGRVFARELPIGMGINLMMDDNLHTMMDIDDSRQPDGAFARYGRRSFITMTSWGVGVTPWMNLGAGFVLSSRSKVRLDQDVTVNGETSNEEMSLSAKPVYGGLAGIQLKTRSLRVGLVYRSQLIDRIEPVSGNTRVTLAGETFQQYPTSMQFTDGFVPEQWVAAVAWSPTPKWTAIAQGDWQRWSPMDDEYSQGDNFKSIDLKTRDVAVPRVAMMYDPSPAWEVRAGYAYEASPFVKPGHDGNVILDADRHTASAGAALSTNPAFLKYPISFDVAGFFTQLVPNKQRTADDRVVCAWGYEAGAAISVALKY